MLPFVKKVFVLSTLATFVIKIFVLSIFEWLVYTGFTILTISSELPDWRVLSGSTMHFIRKQDVTHKEYTRPENLLSGHLQTSQEVC